MASPHYIGNAPTYGQFVKQTVVGNSSSLGPFVLVQNAPSAESMLVVQAGVVLNPSVDYTIADSGATITFATGKAPSPTNTWIVFQGQSLLNASTSAVEVDSFTGDGVDTTFVTTSQPYSPDNLAVFVDGILQSETTNWTLSGSTITFTTAPDNTSPIDVYHFKVVQTGAWSEIPSSVSAFNALAAGKYLVTPPGGGTTVTLPATPTVGDEVQVITAHASNTCSISAAVNINGTASPYALGTKGAKKFVYAGSYGWAVQ